MYMDDRCMDPSISIEDPYTSTLVYRCMDPCISIQGYIDSNSDIRVDMNMCGFNIFFSICECVFFF